MNRQGKHALIAGIALIFMAMAAGYSVGYVNGHILVPGDPETTLKNIQYTPSLFTSGIVGWILIFFADLLVAWSLYHYFKKESQGISLFTAGLRVIYTLFLGIAIFQLIKIYPLSSSNISNAALQILDLYDRFDKVWSLGLIIFGGHLMGLGHLSFYSGTVPRILGILLLIGGLSYSGIHLAFNLFPMWNEQIQQVEMILALPMAVSELALAVWLIWWGRKNV
jgi:hypothetical protein